MLTMPFTHPATQNMASKASEERSLTLNSKKQSWFGSIKSAVHQGALSAKAAVESLRGGSGNEYVPTLSCRPSEHPVDDRNAAHLTLIPARRAQAQKRRPQIISHTEPCVQSLL